MSFFKSSCSSMPDYFQPGSVQVVKNLKIMEDCMVSVEGVCIYKTPLQQGPLQEAGVDIMHHFLMVEVSGWSHPTRGQSKGGFLIRAEKGAGREVDGGNTGITVKDVHFVEEDSFEVKYRVSDLNVSIPMPQLLHILTKHSPDYDVLIDNCWRYADATCRALLETFKKLRPEDTMVMDRHLQQIPTLVMPVDTAVKVVGYGLLVATAVCATRQVYKCLSRGEEDDQIKGE